MASIGIASTDVGAVHSSGPRLLDGGEVGVAEVGFAEVGVAEAGLAEVGVAEPPRCSASPLGAAIRLAATPTAAISRPRARRASRDGRAGGAATPSSYGSVAIEDARGPRARRTRCARIAAAACRIG
jgi:hypothetical protein